MKILSVNDVVERLPFHKSFIYDLIKRGELPAKKAGKSKGIIILEEDLEEWIRNLPSASQEGEPVKHSKEITLLTGGHPEDMRQRP